LHASTLQDILSVLLLTKEEARLGLLDLDAEEIMQRLTRAQIRAPFDGEIISLEVKFYDTIDNVKAKIDSVKAKIQDDED
jgi:multidrug resistance efflux pump